MPHFPLVTARMLHRRREIPVAYAVFDVLAQPPSCGWAKSLRVTGRAKRCGKTRAAAGGSNLFPVVHRRTGYLSPAPREVRLVQARGSGRSAGPRLRAALKDTSDPGAD